MKQGCSLQELAAEVTRQKAARQDFLGSASRMRFTGDKVPRIKLPSVGEFETTELFQRQVADRLSIPRSYYQRLLATEPEFLARNVNFWLERSPDVRMVRTLDGKGRAFLSDRYRRLDNFDLCEAVLPSLQENGFEVKSSAITEKHLYLKAVSPRISTEVKVGDIVQAGLVVSNSEVGLGRFRVEPLLYRLECLNGMILPVHSVKQHHVGRQQDTDDSWSILSDEAKQASDRAFWLRTRDLVRSSCDQVVFLKNVKTMQESALRKIEHPVQVIEKISNAYSLGEEESQGVLRHLADGGDMTQWGLGNAVSRFAQDVPDYQRSTELERISGTIVALTGTKWTGLN